MKSGSSLNCLLLTLGWHAIEYYLFEMCALNSIMCIYLIFFEVWLHTLIRTIYILILIYIVLHEQV